MAIKSRKFLYCILLLLVASALLFTLREPILSEVGNFLVVSDSLDRADVIEVLSGQTVRYQKAAEVQLVLSRMCLNLTAIITTICAHIQDKIYPLRLTGCERGYVLNHPVAEERGEYEKESARLLHEDWGDTTHKS